jgi:NAD(P)-dependent dehydrogenase (short-subunit alcohol dehydrogenase family)
MRFAHPRIAASVREACGAVLCLSLLMASAVAMAGAHTGAPKLPPPPENLVFPEDYQPTALITGSNRGIGLEFARQYAARGWKVIATCRDPAGAADLKALAAEYPGQLEIVALDVTDFARVDALAAQYESRPIDLLLHNAGIGGGSTQFFGAMDFDAYAQVLAVNAIAPLKISEAFFENVQASRDRKIVAVSSSEGSIGGVKQARLYFYRSSKAALNMEMRNLAMQLKGRGIAVGLVNPGMTDTDFMAGLPKRMLRPTEQAVADMMRNIDALSVATTGSFMEYDGNPIPW